VTTAVAEHVWSLALDDYVSVLRVRPSRRPGDGDLVAIGSLGGRAAVVDTLTGTVVAELDEHPFGVLDAAWSASGDRLAVGGHDGVVRLYAVGDLIDGSVPQVRAVGSFGAPGWVARLAWSPTDEVLAAAIGRRLVLLDSAAAVRQQFDPAGSTITDVAWATNGRRVGAIAYGGIDWFDPEASTSAPTRTMAWKGSLLTLALSPDGKWACAGAQDSSVHIWKLWSGDELSMSGYPAKIEHLAFAPDGRWMATACLGEITVWDFAKRGPKGTIPASGSGHRRHVEAMAWSPGGAVLVTGGADGRLVVWPAPRRQREAMVPIDAVELGAGLSRLAWTPDGGLLLVAQTDGTVHARSTAGSSAVTGGAVTQRRHRR
jgi:WD40 repeat protein